MASYEFYINYSKGNDHYQIGPYPSHRLAMSHLDEVKDLNGVTSVWLGTHRKPIRTLVAITTIVTKMRTAKVA